MTYLSTLSIAEKFSISGMMLARGLGTVFMVLLILWGIIQLFGVIFGAKKPAKAVKAPEPEKKPETPVPSAPVVDETPADDNGALVAAIIAAVEAYRAEEAQSAGVEYTLPFRVVSFKRKNGSGGWNSNNTENF